MKSLIKMLYRKHKSNLTMVVGLLLLGYLNVGTLLGQPVNNFTLTNVNDNKSISLNDYSSSPGVLLIFTSTECAFDEYYTGRIKHLTTQAKVPVLLVNSHRGTNEGANSMKNKINAQGITVPYLADKEQTLMTALKVSKSPEVVLLKNSGGNFTIFYQGSIDDNPQVESDVKNSYVKSAIEALLSGQNAPTSTRPVGCFIRR